jgi:myb proto-oncogene protein
MHGGKNWAVMAELIPDRTKEQCNARWKDVLYPNIDRVNRRKGKWTAVENSKLKDAVETYGARNWTVIAALIPGRTRLQCRNRWKDVLDPGINRANGRTRWVEDEDNKLKDAVQTHGGKNWVEIAALVSGRTKSQCRKRWMPTSTGQMDVWINGRKTKTSS